MRLSPARRRLFPVLLSLAGLAFAPSFAAAARPRSQDANPPAAPAQAAAASADPAGARLTQVFQLKYAGAPETAGILDRIVAGPLKGEGGSRLSLAVDARTNSIIAAGVAKDLESVAALIAALDVESDGANINAPKVSRDGPPQGRSGVNQSADEAKRAATAAAAPCRLDMTVFQVSVTPDSALHLEAEALEAQAQSPATLQAALQKIGSTTLLYRFDRSMTSGRPARLEATAAIPVIQSETRVQGQTQSVVNRESLGAKFDVFAEPADAGATKIRLSAEGALSLLTWQELKADSPRTIAVPHKMAASFDGLTRIGVPTVLLAVDTNGGGEGAGVALVVRVLVTQD